MKTSTALPITVPDRSDCCSSAQTEAQDCGRSPEHEKKRPSQRAGCCCGSAESGGKQ
jgi:hypothetical protein